MIQKIKKLSRNIQFQLTLYKLSNDILFYLIIATLGSLLVEGALPGMVSGNNGFIILLFLIFAIILVISKLGAKLHISFKSNKRSHFFPFAIFFSFILIGNSLLKFSLIENLIITTSTIFIIALFYKTVFSEQS